MFNAEDCSELGRNRCRVWYINKRNDMISCSLDTFLKPSSSCKKLQTSQELSEMKADLIQHHLLVLHRLHKWSALLRAGYSLKPRLTLVIKLSCWKMADCLIFAEKVLAVSRPAKEIHLGASLAALSAALPSKTAWAWGPSGSEL